MKRRKTKFVIPMDEDAKAPKNPNEELIKKVKRMRRSNVLNFGGKR